MNRSGLGLPLNLLIILVIGMAVVAILAGSFYMRSASAGNQTTSHANSSTLRSCEERIQTYCTFHPDGDWGGRHSDCVKYKDTISNGNTQCTGTQDGTTDTNGDGGGNGDGPNEVQNDGQETGDDQGGDSQSWDTSSCEAMGGTCHDQPTGAAQQLWNQAPGKMYHDTSDCGENQFCYVPAGNECEIVHGGTCKPSTDRQIFEDREGEIVSAGCSGFCYVPAVNVDTCDTPDYCVSSENTDICPGFIDDRGDQDGCFSRESDSGGTQNMVCCRNSQQEESADEQLDVHFITDSVGDSAFNSRVDAYISGIQSNTPLDSSCWSSSVSVKRFGPDETRSSTGDITFRVSSTTAAERAQEKDQDGRIDGEARFHGGVTMYADVPDGVKGVVAAHELSHVVGLCDEYSRDAWESWNAEFSSTSQIGFDGCPNPWPSDTGRHPTAFGDTSFNDACSQVGGSDLAYSCGRDLDGDSGTPDASIMGTGGALYGDQWAVPLSGLPPEDAGTFLTELQEVYGVTCE